MIFKELSGLSKEEREGILKRAKAVDTSIVEQIIRDVRGKGDEALLEYTKKFDKAMLRDLRVSDREFEKARQSADKTVVEALETAYKNIRSFHEAQLEKGFWHEEPGKKLGQILRPVESAGCYVPGGRAYYPSTVLMAAVPAKVAGVRRVVVTTPPREDGSVNEYTLVACKIAGVDEVYKVGGAQAIAALAYGTESIPKVDMIAGPGNVYVTAAKKAVYGDVGVDMLAGPSEVLIIADAAANVDYIVSDLLAQAEHDPSASCVLVTTDDGLGKRVKGRLDGLGKALPKALENLAILTAKDLGEALEFSNQYAPEHLEILTEDPESLLKVVKNAGSVFLGEYSPVAVGDYASGTNHILPTGGCARFQSGLNVSSFMKKISVQRLSKEGLQWIGENITTLAETEGLKYHSESVKKRLK